MDQVKDDRKLKNKTNYVSWKREFERAAKTNDVLEYLTGEDAIPPKPKMEDYLMKHTEVNTRRPVRTTRTAQSFTPSTDDDDETDDAQTITLSANNTLRWQIESSEYEKARKKMKLAGKLLHVWVCEGIQIEMEDCKDAKEAYDFIKKRYAVTNERARDDLLSRLNRLKLDDYSPMTEYTNKVRQIKADLKTVKYDMTDDMLATALLHGLPPNFRDFKEKYDWIRSTKPDDPPDLDFLYERLHVEEAKQIQLREERRVKERTRLGASGNTNNPNSGTSHNDVRRTKREDRSHLRCTYPGCGKTGHTEETCWTKDPSKAPRSLKDKFTANAANNDTENIVATTETNVNTFRDAYTRADALSMAPSPTSCANTADASP